MHENYRKVFYIWFKQISEVKIPEKWFLQFLKWNVVKPKIPKKNCTKNYQKLADWYFIPCQITTNSNYYEKSRDSSQRQAVLLWPVWTHAAQNSDQLKSDPRFFLFHFYVHWIHFTSEWCSILYLWQNV